MNPSRSLRSWRDGRPSRVSDVIARVAHRRDIPAGLIVSNRRGSHEAPVVAARRECIFELRAMGFSLPQIGKYVGIHHSSVSYHLRDYRPPKLTFDYPVPDESGVWAI